MDCSLPGSYVHGIFQARTLEWGAIAFSDESYSAQFSSVALSCPTPCDPMNHSTTGFPVHHQLPGFTQTHVREGSMLLGLLSFKVEDIEVQHVTYLKLAQLHWVVL